MIQTPNYEGEEVHFLYSGGVALCEPTSFGEPIVIFRPGAVMNLHAIMFEENLRFKYVAVSEN